MLFAGVMVTFFVIAFLGLPIVWAILAATLLYMGLSESSYTFEGMALAFIGGIEPFHLLAVPMFILAGELMGRGGVSARLIDFASKCLSFLPGSLGVVTVSSSMVFAGVSGSAVADSAAVGGIMIPGMQRRGYTASFAAALVAVAGTIGIIIPPSIPMIVFAFLAGTSVKDLFLAGIIPGLLFGFGLIAWCMWVARHNGWDPGARLAPARDIGRSFIACLPALLMPVIILGGIFGGVFTPTEAGAVAIAYALVVGLWIYRELSLHDLPGILLQSFTTSATVMLVIGATTALAWVITLEGVPFLLVDAIRSITSSTAVFLLIVNVLLLLLGIFLEPVPALVLTAPLLLPVAKAMGVDPVHFGLIVTCNLALGLFTPPVGGTLFVAAKIANARMGKITRDLVPMFVICLVVLAIVTYIPGFVMAPVTWFR
ncbi:TRAP transporter large permease [Microvirga massiliensis]|uniref:TRAP transporter large permease n=1 Tax=Microvirga massiliensis TaxID=1033741 RepID=UPI00062B851E|nr:TRAP transporter large permease [Microvirga massiliensis]